MTLAAVSVWEKFASWCQENIGPRGATGWVYFVGMPEQALVKIGYAAGLAR